MLLLADFVARHALVILLGLTAMMLLLTALFWRVVARYAPLGWTIVARAWDRLRNTALGRRLKRLPVLGPFLTRTLTIVRYLGIYAVTAFVVAAGAVVLFFELADEIGVDESLAQLDVALSAALHEHLSYRTLRVFALVTKLGEVEFLVALGALVTVILLASRRWILAGAWVAATVSGGLLTLLLKAIFERQRPLHEHGLIAETGWGFPSGHASGSMLVYGLLGYLIVRHTPKAWHVPVVVLTVGVIVFVGSSRVLLQVHYLSDVLAGYVSAAAWVALCIAGLEAARWRQGSPSNS